MYLLLKPINVIRLKKIILIEDDAAILDTMRWMFGPPEFELITFSNGNKIIDGLFDTPDLFIIDKQLPGIDGLDIDVEESMSLGGIVRLVDRLATDFGREFVITLAPVATAMQGSVNLSGFDYEVLEKGLGSKIAWYNVQFYCGWGNLRDTIGFELSDQ